MLTFVIIKSNESLSEVTGYFSSDDPIKKETTDIDSWVDIAVKRSNKDDVILVAFDGDENTSDPLNVHACDEFLKKIEEHPKYIKNHLLDMKNNFPF